MSWENKNSGKGYIRTDKKIQKTILMANIDKPDIIKEKHTKWYSLVLVERSAVKSASKMFIVTNQYIRSNTRKEKYNQYMIKLKWMEYHG